MTSRIDLDGCNLTKEPGSRSRKLKRGVSSISNDEEIKEDVEERRERKEEKYHFSLFSPGGSDAHTRFKLLSRLGLVSQFVPGKPQQTL